MLYAIHQPVVNLIANYQKIIFGGNFGNLAHPFDTEYCPGRVIRVADQNSFGFLSDARFDLRSGHLKLVLDLTRNRHRHTTGKSHLRRIGHKTRLRHNHFITRVEDRGERQIHRLTHAHRDQDFHLRVVVHPIHLVDVLAKRRTQRQGAAVAGIAGFAAHKRCQTFIQHRLRGHKVRLADSQRDHIFHRRRNIEKLANPRRRDRIYTL